MRLSLLAAGTGLLLCTTCRRRRMRNSRERPIIVSATGRSLYRQQGEEMAEKNRIPDKKIGEVAHAEQLAERTAGHKPPHGPGAPEKEAVRANPDRDPSKKKTGEF
jgi:hypothetical protein